MAVAAVLGVAYDRASSFQQGSAAGPSAIRAAFASGSTNQWSEAGHDLADVRLLEDAGDIAPGDARVREEIEQAVSALLDRGRTPIVLGGDHSISYPAIRAFRNRGPFAILHFDAHPDLYPEFEGNRYSHACPFARVLEDGLTRELVQVGIRTMNAQQAAQVSRYGVRVVSPAEWDEGWRFKSTLPVYLSVDLDVLDPAFAPGVSHPEPGGCSTRQLISTLQRIPNPIIGADIVELNPQRDPQDLTARVAAKLLKEIAALIVSA